MPEAIGAMMIYVAAVCYFIRKQAPRKAGVR